MKSNKPKVKYEEINITPARAIKMLEKNTENRPISQLSVKKIAHAMEQGEWIFNGDPIRFNKEGVLIDGQHRLMAIAKCGLMQRMIVMTGLPVEAFKTIDIGKTRSSGDILALKGYKKHHELASITRKIISYERSQDPFTGTVGKYPSNTEILERVESDPLVVAACQFAQNQTKARILAPVSAIGFCKYIFDTIDEDMTRDFFSEISTGIPSYENSPAQSLREAIFANRGRERLSHKARAAMMFKALGLFHRMKSVKYFRLHKEPSRWFEISRRK